VLHSNIKKNLEKKKGEKDEQKTKGKQLPLESTHNKLVEALCPISNATLWFLRSKFLFIPKVCQLSLDSLPKPKN